MQVTRLMAEKQKSFKWFGMKSDVRMENQSIQLTNGTMAYIDKGQGTPIVPLACFLSLSIIFKYLYPLGSDIFSSSAT